MEDMREKYEGELESVKEYQLLGEIDDFCEALIQQVGLRGTVATEREKEEYEDTDGEDDDAIPEGGHTVSTMWGSRGLQYDDHNDIFKAIFIDQIWSNVCEATIDRFEEAGLLGVFRQTNKPIHICPECIYNGLDQGSWLTNTKQKLKVTDNDDDRNADDVF